MPDAIERATTLIADHDGPLVVVASALGGITDLLIGGAERAARGASSEAAARASAFLQRHRQAVKALLPPGRKRRALLSRIDDAAREYRDLCGAVAVLGHLEPRTMDLLVSRGERMSAALLAEALSARRRRAVYVDATEFVATDGVHGGAAPDLPRTARAARRVLTPLVRRRMVPVVPGYIGRASDGSVATLGRGGSDLTATLLGRSLGARQVVLWKDVPGILTADPRLVPDARLLSHLHHREAAEVAHYGAKVLHPRALIPIAGTRIVLHVRSFLNLSSPGTKVSAQRGVEGYPVKALAIVHGQAIVTVAGKGMVGVHGIAARTFAAVDTERLSVSTIFQASSESSIGFTVPRSRSRTRRASRARGIQGRIGQRCDRQRQRATGHRGRGGRRRRNGGGARDCGACVFGARRAQHQRRGDRAGILGTEHFVCGERRRCARSRSCGPRRLSAVEDWRRPAAGRTADRRCACSGSATSGARWPITLPRPVLIPA